ncbi:MAG: antibiotic biosynthesis monooxygenase [Oscillospiraceae bacterium]|nr:antibiotic biosynthesis monooxygenase [Oscillospiraceae bacterium]
MYYHIVTNNIKPGTREAYTVISKEFCAAMVEFGAQSAITLYDEQNPDSVVNITIWADKAQQQAFMASGIPEQFYPRLGPYFAGNADWYLTEV